MPIAELLEHLTYSSHYIPDPLVIVKLTKEDKELKFCLSHTPENEDELTIFSSGVINRLCDEEKCSWHHKNKWLDWKVELEDMETGEINKYVYNYKKEIFIPGGA